MDDLPAEHFDDFDDDDDDENDWEAECGLALDGQCSQAGTEHCDFCCPNRTSELFSGSAAWYEKHKPKKGKTST